MKTFTLTTVLVLWYCFINAQSWSPLGSGANSGANTLAEFNGELYAGGDFWTTGGITTNGIARWDGNSWDSVSSGVSGSINALAVYNNELYAGGEFYYVGGTTCHNIAKWNGSTWSAVGTGVTAGSTSWNTEVLAMVVYNGELYIAGNFTDANGITANHIVKWDGAVFSSLGSGMNDRIKALAVHNGDLYAGGDFSTAGGSAAKHVARWNGSSWSALGTGFTTSGSYVAALASYKGYLYAGGNFTDAGATVVNHVARWNGSAWSAVGSGLSTSGTQYVGSFGVYHNELYVGGFYVSSNGINLAKWNGNAWVPSVSSPDDAPNAFSIYNSEFHMAGKFNQIGATSINKIAKLACSAYFTIAPDTAVAHNWIATNLATGTPPLTYSWDWNDGTTFSSGPTPVHTYVIPAYYNICLTITDMNGCTETYCDSSTYINRSSSAGLITVNVVMPTGVKELNNDHIVSFYPNPVSGYFTVAFAETIDDGMLDIYTVSGERVFAKELHAIKEVKVEKLFSSGMYIIKVYDGRTSISRKIVFN